MRLKVFVGLIMLPGAMTPQENLALSLRDAVRMALSPRGNLAISESAQSLRAAEAQWREARSARLPEVEASFTGQNQVLNLAAMGFDEVHVPVKDFSFPRSIGPLTTINARVRVKQDLVNVATRRRSQAFRAGLETAKAGTDETRDAVAAEVAKLYFTALRAAGAIDLAQAIRSAAESLLSEVVNRMAAGEAMGIDVSHARARVTSSKQRVMQAQMERSRATFDLLATLNRDLDTPLKLTDDLAYSPQETPTAADALATALKSRAEVLAQRQLLRELRLKDVSIESERLPSLNSFADLGTLGTSVPSSVPTYNVGISLHVPILDGGRRNAQREETQALICREELRKAQLEKQVELEVRHAILSLDMARELVTASDDELEAAAGELAHRKRRYERGIDGLAELSDAQVAFAEAQDGRLEALYRWNEARIELLQAKGTILTLTQ
ncbi:MAG TPA: TolC family protein [Bryobacteraceae bacterium]|nr:TolC family protein [Bryobacteraceae bacterium]